MNKDQILCEMSNSTSEIEEKVQYVQSQSENKQTGNGLRHEAISISSVVEELPLAPISVISSSNEINSNNLGSSLTSNNPLPEEQSTITVLKEKLRPCAVVLQRSQTVEAAWQRELLQRQRKRTSHLSKAGKSSEPSKELTPHCNRKSVVPLSYVERSEAGFTCQLCGNTFPGRTSFMQHVRSNHSSTCDVCAKVLSSTQKLKDHLRFVHGKSETSWEQKLFMSSSLKYPCTFCHKNFGSQSSLDKHIIFKHSAMDSESSQSDNSELNSFKCEYCEEKFSNKVKLREHIFEKHIDEEVKNENTEDNSQYLLDELSEPSSSNLEQNKNTPESNGPPVTAYECPHCLTLHANKDRFKKHLGFVWPDSFSEHQVSVNPQMLARQKEPVSCEVCGARAANLAFLHTHQSSHPELKRPHVCPEPCNRKFLFRCQLDRHALIHQVGAPAKSKIPSDKKLQVCETNQCGRHRCTICSKRTRSEARLSSHIACCHKGGIDYRCKICDVCFPSAKSLERHCNKKQHAHDEQSNHSNEPWVSPETPCISVLNNTHNNITQSVRPDSLGSSDSVSTSDAFSMYFQSLHSLGSLDMALDIGSNASIFENVDEVLAPTVNRNSCFATSTTVTSQLLHGRPGVTEVTEINNHDNADLGNELQFHTLQTVPVEPLSEIEASYLQNIKVEPLSQIEPSTTLENMEVDTIVHNESLFDKTESMETQENTSFSQNMMEDQTATSKLEPTFQPIVQETTELSQLESYLVLTNNLQNQYPNPINIDDICSATEPRNVLSVETPIPVIIPSPIQCTTQAITSVQEESQTELNIVLDASQQEQEMNYSVDIDNSVKEHIIVKNEPSNCDSKSIDFTSSIKIENKNDDLDTIPDVSNITFLPELNEADCNIQLLADTCDSSSLSDLSISLPGDLNAKIKNIKKQGGSCPDCGKVFSSAHSAARHAKLSCPGRDAKSLQVSCPQCDLVLADRKELHKHKREIHPDTLFTCSACTKTFFLIQSLARHQKESCSHRETFPCRQCKIVLSSIEELRSHTAEMHPGILATCEICGKTLSSPQSLRRHLRSHKPEDKPLSTLDQGNTEKQKEEKTDAPVNNNNQPKPKADKKKKINKVEDMNITENTLDQSLSLPSIETIRSNVIPNDQMLDGTFDIKTEVGIDNKGESQVSSLAEDLLCDFASISTNQLFNSNLNGDTDLQEEFSISDMFLIKNGALQCDFCHVSFPSDKLLLHHLSSQHFPNTQWQPAQPLSQSASSIVANLNVASTSTQGAGSQCDLPGTSF